MASVHVAYQFNDASGAAGFGDCCILDFQCRTSADVVMMKDRLRQELIKEGRNHPTVVILSFHELES
jgi:hypothetical protein